MADLELPSSRFGAQLPRLAFYPQLNTEDWIQQGLDVMSTAVYEHDLREEHTVFKTKLTEDGEVLHYILVDYPGCSFFSRVAKMSCPSWSIPAGPPAIGGSCPAAGPMVGAPPAVRAASAQAITRLTGIPVRGRGLPRAGEKTFVCSVCYAGKNNYANTSTQAWQIARHTWFKHWERNDSEHLIEQLVAAVAHMAVFLRKTKAKYWRGVNPRFFRIHDSGDYDSLAAVEIWNEVARRSPKILFWSPTRMWVFPKFVEVMSEAPENLAIRPSALHFDDPAPDFSGLSGGSGVSAEDKVSWSCPVYSGQSQTCKTARRPRLVKGNLLPGGRKTCRFCWGGMKTGDLPYKNLDVSYHGH